MNRRTFLAGSLGMVGLRSEAGPIQITVDRTKASHAIGPDFIGLGYEISSVATPGLLSSANRKYVQLVRTLGQQGVIRVGGNTSDFSSFKPNAASSADPNATVINNRNLHELGTFLKATGWNLIWGLNLGRGSEADATVEAQAVASAAGDSLLAFEIGNEPDLFGRGSKGPRHRDYSYADYLTEFRRYKTAVRAKLPNASFAGPDVAGATDWVARFSVDEGSDLKLLTHHYYRECAGPESTLDKLLKPDPKLKPQLDQLEAASSSSRVPYRFCETNSFCGGGKPGVSDTFGSAVWMLDFMFQLASSGAAGVNIETGVNQLGFVSSYSPIGDDGHGKYSAEPDLYGMLAFATAGFGKLLSVRYDPGTINLTAYAALHNANTLRVTLINKDLSHDAAVGIELNGGLAKATAMRLIAPSPESENGVSFGGSSVSSSGQWSPDKSDALPVKGGKLELLVPACSATVITVAAVMVAFEAG